MTTTVYTVSFSSFHMHMILIGIGFDTNYEQITGNLTYITGYWLLVLSLFLLECMLSVDVTYCMM